MRPLLVEGISDSIICHGIERKLDMFIEAAGVQIVPIIGKGQFPIVYKFFTLIGKEPIIMADGDAFTDCMSIPLIYTESAFANDIAVERGYSSINKIIKDIFNDYCQLADSLKVTYKELLENTAYWKNRESDDDDLKIYRRAFLSLIYTETTILQNQDVVKMKTRLDSLFSILNEIGCFILKKGTIESYYAQSDAEISYGKPIAAVEEVDFFNSKDKNFVISQYNDIYDCLTFAAKTKEINEVEALRDLLLSILAPVMASLGKNTTQMDIQSKIRSTIGERGELFDISINPTDKTKISVNVKSKILEINCFPFEINKTDNLVVAVNQKLGLSNTM